TRLPDGSGSPAITRTSDAATLVGIEAPARSGIPLELKPYITANGATDRTTSLAAPNTFGKDFGFDAKYGLSENVTADFTYNTDFAQVEADEQQLNLTRFSLFFPEKRDFFLENQGVFGFGGTGTSSGGDTPVLFYSRRIGLQQGRAIPVRGGGRV